MPFRWNPREHGALGLYFLKWLLIGIPVGAIIGSAVAVFLWSLDLATRTRWNHPWLLFLLPIGGIGVGLLYYLFGKTVEGGNNLIMEQIHEPGGGVPSRMAPLVLIGTVLTHLFGGSAGREGTAVQMGGSIAGTVCRWFRLNPDDTRTLLMAGIAGGFGAVFGTPLTGAIFGVEVLSIGLVSFQSIVPCLIASVVGEWVCTAWDVNWGWLHFNIRHTQYHIGAIGQMGLVHSAVTLNWLLLGKVAIAAIAFGLASVVFAELAHGLQRVFKRCVPWPVLRPALGGLLMIGLAYLIGGDYLGLGVSADPHHPNQVSLLSCFHAGGAGAWSWWWKILFTTITLSSGFKGGEVTPLFFVGAALGNTMARLLHAPVDLMAGLGFVAVFSGATNTPLACIIMGIELFAGGQPGLIGSGFVVYVATACFVANLLSGHSGIYLSQRIGAPKVFSPALPPGASLRTARELQPRFGQNFIAVFKQVTSNGDNLMPHRHQIKSREIGQVRIYMTPLEKRKIKGLRGMFGKPLYQEIIDAAKADGLLNAAAHHTHYGYSGNGKIQANHQELRNERLNLCVELIAHRDELELFCRKHGELLKGKVVVYKHMEYWDVGIEYVMGQMQ